MLTLNMKNMLDLNMLNRLDENRKRHSEASVMKNVCRETLKMCQNLMKTIQIDQVNLGQKKQFRIKYKFLLG